MGADRWPVMEHEKMAPMDFLPCPHCGNKGQPREVAPGPGYEVKCERCGWMMPLPWVSAVFQLTEKGKRVAAGLKAVAKGPVH